MGWLLRKCILFAFWGAVAFSALLAIFALSVGQLLPYLDHYRPQIERNLQQIVGYPVTLTQIDGRLEGIDPTISVEGFTLTANGDKAIRIEEMRVRLDTVKSLLSLSPQFTYIRFVQSTVDLQERDGIWRLKGATPSRNVSSEVGVERVLDYLAAQRNFSLLEASVHLDSAQLGEHVVRIPQIYLFQKAFESLLTAEVYLDDEAAPIRVNARLDKTRSLLGNYRVKASIQAPNLSLPLTSLLKTHNFGLSSVELGSELWLDILVGKEFDVQTRDTHIKVSFNDGEQYQLRSDLKFHFSQNRPSMRLEANDLTVEDSEGKRYPMTDVTFDWSSLTQRANLAFDRLDLAVSNQIASRFIPEASNAGKILTGLSPQGMAKNGVVRLWQEEGMPSFQFMSNLQSASIQAHNGIPRATKVNGVISLSNDEGYVDFSAQESLVYFDTVYDEAWQTDRLSGHVSWQKQQDTFLVAGRDLQVQRLGATVEGGFRLEVRPTEPDWIALDLHGTSLSVNERLTYIPPKALSPELKAWIEQAFQGDGQIPRADVLIHGELSGEAVPHVRVALDVANLDVEFDKSWPAAKKVQGSFALDASGVSVLVDSGFLLDLPVTGLSIHVPIVDGAAPWLHLSGDVNEEAATVLSTLRQTPLSESVLEPFENWYVGGQVKGRYDVSVPFNEEVEPNVRLSLQFEDNTLDISDIQLASYVQTGQLNFDSDKGITDSVFEFQSLGGVSMLVLTSSTSETEDLSVIGDLSGYVDVKKVAEWNKLPNAGVTKLEGQASYTGQLAINRSQPGQIDVEIDSQLLGVRAALPEPLGKTAEVMTPLKVKVRKHENDIVIDVDYASMTKARLLLQNDHFVGGELLLGNNENLAFRPSIPNGLMVTGDFERFYVDDWLAVLSDVEEEEKDTSPADAPMSLSLPDWLSQANFIVDEVVVNEDNTWHNFKVNYTVAGSRHLLISADELNLSLTNKAGLPDAHFGFLSWNTSTKADSNNEEAVAPISAYQIPNMTLSIDQFYLNEQPYGDWQLNVQQQGGVVQIDPIHSKLTTGQFNGSLIWRDKAEDSEVVLSLAAKGADLAELTGKFSNEAFVSSKQYNMGVDLNWKGHPFYFDRASVSGRIAFSAEDGNFKKIEELPAFLKALGIFNIGALSRRLSLDFSDVYEPGLTYDTFKGSLSLGNGLLRTVSPITIISPTAELVVAGEADIVNETLNEKLTATFPISGTLPLAGLLLGTPQLAGILFITDKLIGDQLSKVTSVQYKVEGSFDNPTMTPIRYQPLGKTK
ncbi:YhdP family protein [Marinomonas algarum]|uniref:TIGR02099 family protein n=1 Tax=Marinomonas algarum TaxID=2883105 RepID=A0A9X1LDY1_9GAMM|nr:YhdP family protein [Marinomonas algarum]MCB5160573.1 TIGR02099 family protein [Marinomonas algarum]